MPWHSPSFISINTLYLLNCGRNTSGSILTTTTALPSSVSTTIRIALARIASTLHRFFDKLAQTDLLILNDFGMKVLDGQQLLDFMEIIEDRHGQKATIIISQLPVADWYDVMKGNTTAADAILDRLVHTSVRFELKGVSLRQKNNQKYTESEKND